MTSQLQIIGNSKYIDDNENSLSVIIANGLKFSSTHLVERIRQYHLSHLISKFFQRFESMLIDSKLP